MIKLKSIDVKGFRSFGNETQTLDLSEKVNFIWAGNSQGKTSFTEALEFLLTGSISRRELLASSKDEFADALKNAFLQDTDEVYVELEINRSGSPHKIKRVLTQDFGKKHDCTSDLFVDGQKVAETKLAEMGFVFNVAPLSTPILMQHCLSYLLTTKPQDRAEFFKAVFEIADVEDFRNAVEKAISEIPAFQSVHVTALSHLAGLEAFKEDFTKCLKASDKNKSLDEIVKGCIKRLLGEKAKDDHDENVVVFEDLHNGAQKVAFPIPMFGRGNIQEWSLASYSLEPSLKATAQLQLGIDSKLKNFVSLYTEIESLNKGSMLPLPQNECPACKSNDLTPERLQEIKDFLKDNRDYQKSLSDLTSVLKNTKERIKLAEASATLPKFLSVGPAERKEKGFTVSNIKAFVDETSAIQLWLSSLRSFARAERKFKASVTALKTVVEAIEINNLAKIDLGNLTKSLSTYESNFATLKTTDEKYKIQTQGIHEKIQAKVSEKTNTMGWKQLIELAKNMGDAQKHLADLYAFTEKQKVFSNALEDIDKAKAKILDSKFGALSSDIKKWWNLLRPEERSYFEHIKPRSVASKRNIDFKVGLASGAPGSTPIVRDAIAVFSQSQISCLGLASFLAKKINGANTFLVLDDPILAVDEDHRAHFVHDVVEELINSGIQLILLTQDQKTWSSLENLYASHEPSTFQFELDNPADGTKIVNKGDSAKARLSSIKTLVRNRNVDIRKLAATRMRDAAERMCKEILVIEKTSEGERVDITTYDGKTLEALCPLVNPYLKDAAHPGKLKNIKDILNPGNHDDEVPNQGDLSTVYGDLQKFEEVYVQRKPAPKAP
jgi:hypothetical protein